MKELEDTKCEIRRCIDLQLSIWDGTNVSAEEDGISQVGSPGYNGGSSAPLGRFLDDVTYAWLSSGPRLVVVNVKTGTSISSWTFSHKVTCVSAFAAQPGQSPLLLVGLDNGASKVRDSSGLVCVYDCATSQILRAIRMPAGVEQVCVMMSGIEGEEFGDERADNLIRENNGMACVALRNLDHLIIDLRRTSWEGPEATPVADESNPADLDFSERNETSSSRHKYIREKHAAYNLMNSRLEQYIGFNRDEFESSSMNQESLTSSLICSRKIGCLISGCLGRIIIWQMDGAVRWVSPPMDDSTSVSHLALLEPTDDPRPFCYLWAAHHNETSRSSPILRMYAMLFERKYTDKGANVYLNLESDPSLKFELELDDGNSMISVCPIIRESNPEQTESGNKRGEDSLLLINLNNRTLLFDLNQWYKEQMPYNIGECHNQNVFLASYTIKRNNVFSPNDDGILDTCYTPGSLKEFSHNVTTPSDELFYPNSLFLEWTDLGTKKLLFHMTRGLQADLLREMSIAGPVILIEPSTTFNRCSSAGLISINPETNTTIDKDQQREILLSLFLEQRWSQFLLKCGKDWSDGSPSNLFHSFLRWAMQRASTLKLTAHRLCIPLYDQSGTSIGETEVKTLRFFAQQLDCITTVVKNLSIDTVDLAKQKRALTRVSTYLQVLLWFYDVGLLPETQDIDDESTLPIGFSLKIPYPFEKLAILYRDKRKRYDSDNSRKNFSDEKNLFIDELVARECGALKPQWKREGTELNVDGDYPPPSLQSLLRSYLTDCHVTDSNEMENKHQITIYLLMDLAMLLQRSCPGVDQLIKYPSAFKLSPSMIKLTQALWLLDHEDYHGFLDMMTGQLVSDCDVKDWHHKLVLRTLIRNNQNKLALIYLRVRKPPLSSLDDQGTVISLSVEHGLVQSAFHRRPSSHYAQLLTRFFQACKIYGKLNDILHLALDPIEEDAFVKFLEMEKSDDTRLLYYLQRCRYSEASTIYPASLSMINRGNSQKSKQSSSLTIYTAYNATLPNVARKFSDSVTSRRNVDIDPDSRYPRPMSHRKNRANARELHDTAMKKAKETFLRGDRTQIPFISAPCSSLRDATKNVETNCVMFVERANKSYGKRTLDDMRDADGDCGDDVDGERSDERKRRKTLKMNETATANDCREVGMSMVFDTPLVKRKNQMINARNTTIETPQSILKIRQMIRDSTSPVVASRNSSIEPNDDKERKPRQIRFSIGRKSDESSINDITKIEDDERSLDRDNIDEESCPDEKIAIATCSLTNKRDEFDDKDEVYFSPDVTDKSLLSESAILTDNSSIVRNVSSGPRPRPGLRSSNASSIDDSSSDRLRRSAMKTQDSTKKLSLTPRSSDCSIKTSDDVSASSFQRETRITKIPHTPRARASLLSTSIYSTSILSSDTSFDNTPLVIKSETKKSTKFVNTITSFVDQSVDKCRDVSECHGDFEVTDNLDDYHREIPKKIVVRSDSVDYRNREIDDDENSEILMEVDGFGLDRDSETRSRADVDTNLGCGIEKSESFDVSTIRSSTIIEESRMEMPRVNVDNADKIAMETKRKVETTLEERSDDRGNERVAPSESRKNDETLKGHEEVKNFKVSEDYDDELMALRYEEDDDDDDDDHEETFQSFADSLEIAQPNDNSRNVEETSAMNDDKPEKMKIIVDDDNITDDESSRSRGPSMTNESTSMNNDVLEKTVSIEKMINDNHQYMTNITDDESNSTYDSSIFTNKNRNNVDRKISSECESLKNMNDVESSSFDSSIFSGGFGKTSKTLKIETEKMNDPGSTSPGESVASFNVDNDVNDERSSDRESSPRKKSRKSTRLSKIIATTPKKLKNSEDSSETMESANVTPLRVTRSRRASSVAHEVPSSPLPDSPMTKSSKKKIGGLRRSMSLATDVFPSSPLTITDRTSSLESPSRKPATRRSVSMAKEILIGKITNETSKNDEDVPIRRSTRKATSVQREILESPKTTPVKLKKSSSKVSLNDENADDDESAITKKKGRSKKTESIVKDIESDVSVVGASKRSTRATSSIKKISEHDETNVDESIRPKRRTRAASVVKEIPEDDENNVDESSGPKRLTRASSIVNEIFDDNRDTMEITKKRGTRKRAMSVPKDVQVTTLNQHQRLRRCGSVTDYVIIEEDNSTIDDNRKNRIVGEKSLANTMTGSPTTSVRSRLSSISSIPEEDDDEIFTTTKIAENRRQASARERRAVSVDAPQVEIKRRTRAGSVKRCTSEDAIVEESGDVKIAVERKTRVTRKTTTRRGRTGSVTSVKEDEDEDENEDEEAIEDVDEAIVDKSKPRRRGKKFSQKSNDDGKNFRFSPPDRAQDKPDDDHKDIGDVPAYVFSPPHTRSKHSTSIRPRRKIKDFIPLTDKERMAAKRFTRPKIITIEKPRKSSLDLWSPYAGFILPKRYNSTT